MYIPVPKSAIIISGTGLKIGKDHTLSKRSTPNMANSPNTNAKKTSAPDFLFIIKILSTLLIKREVHNININYYKNMSNFFNENKLWNR